MIGEVIKQIRVDAGISQMDLAKKLNYKTSQFISNWERNLSLPTPHAVGIIAEVCKVDKKVLIGEIFKAKAEILKTKVKEQYGDFYE